MYGTKQVEKMETNNTLLEALQSGKLLTFKNHFNWVENNVKIISLNSDDIENKDFIFETKNGQRYNQFSNNIIIL